MRAKLKGWLKEFRERVGQYLPRQTKRIAIVLLSFILGLAMAKIAVELVTEEIAIFGFHDIIDVSNPAEVPPRRAIRDGDYTKQDLEDLIDYLLQHHFWFLSTQDLYDYFIGSEPKPIPPEHQGQKKVMVTVDDGYKSAHHNLMAIAESMEEKYGEKIKIVWFINPPFLGVSGSQLQSGLDRVSCDELKEGFQSGFYDLQSHGANHTDLTQLSAEDLDRDLSKAQTLLRDCTQDLDPDITVANHIAYPFGSINNKVEKYVKKYYLSGYNYNNSTLKGKLDNFYNIPRISIHKRIPVKRLIRLAEGGWI